MKNRNHKILNDNQTNLELKHNVNWAHCDSTILTQKGLSSSFRISTEHRNLVGSQWFLVSGTRFTHTRSYQKDNRIPWRIDQILIYFYKVSVDEYSYLSVVGKTRYRIFVLQKYYTHDKKRSTQTKVVHVCQKILFAVRCFLRGQYLLELEILPF